jgi:hypothetical protein
MKFKKTATRACSWTRDGSHAGGARDPNIPSLVYQARLTAFDTESGFLRLVLAVCCRPTPRSLLILKPKTGFWGDEGGQD